MGVFKFQIFIGVACLISSCVLIDGSPKSGPNGGDLGPIPTDLKPLFSSIKPGIFQRHGCYTCHTAGASAQGVPMESAGDLVNSPRDLVIPGNADESGLVIAITRNDSHRMPPPDFGPELQEEEILMIKQWIKEGAK